MSSEPPDRILWVGDSTGAWCCLAVYDSGGVVETGAGVFVPPARGDAEGRTRGPTSRDGLF